MHLVRWVHLRQVLVNAAFGAKAETNIIPEIKHPFSTDTKINVISIKRLVGVQEDVKKGKMKVLFADGSEYGDFDLVIGADGWKSTARDFTSNKAETILASISIIGRTYCLKWSVCFKVSRRQNKSLLKMYNTKEYCKNGLVMAQTFML